MEEVVKLLAPLNTTKLEAYAEGTDISPWMRAGVPGEASFCLVHGFICLSWLLKIERGTLSCWECCVHRITSPPILWTLRKDSNRKVAKLELYLEFQEV